MARGGLPILEFLCLDGEGWRWDAELGPAMVAAFEGVADTLKELALVRRDFRRRAENGAEVQREQLQFGEAIGKLRRLETLKLGIYGQGGAYHQLAKGMGKESCPALRSVACFVEEGAVWMACRPSIIRPSVQHLKVCFPLYDNYRDEEPLALACALTSLGYRGTVVMKDVLLDAGQDDLIRSILPPQVFVTFESSI
jgi:hypothetical protein